MPHEHYTHTAPDIPSSTALSIFFFLLHFLLMQLLFFYSSPFRMDWCVEGSATYPQRKALFEEQRSHMEAELEQMNRTLDMLKFKCWYYEQAIKDGSEDRLKALIPDRLPEEIRKAYENAHR